MTLVVTWWKSRISPLESLGSQGLLFLTHKNKAALWVRESRGNVSSETWGGGEKKISLKKLSAHHTLKVTTAHGHWVHPWNFSLLHDLWCSHVTFFGQWNGFWTSPNAQKLRETSVPPFVPTNTHFCLCHEKNVPRLALPPGGEWEMLVILTQALGLLCVLSR